MKYLLLILTMSVTLHSYSQEGYDMVELTEEQAVQLPWFGSPDFLENILLQEVGDANARGRATVLDAKYYVPVRFVIYRDDAGNANSAITRVDAQQILDDVNNTYRNTGIKFFVRYFDEVNDSDYRSGLENILQVGGMFLSNWKLGVINIHLIRNTSGSLSGGFAINPEFPSVPNTQYSCYVRTHGVTGRIDQDVPINHDRLVSTLGHELGHNLGLLHTHHPGRFISLAQNDNNADIDNKCYQELVSRTHKNNVLCASTSGDLSCSVNGDFLCDTAADPNISPEEARWVDGDCNYTWTGGGDYEFDQVGNRWSPPTRNIMSYTSAACRREFTWQQKAVMWYYLENNFVYDYDPGFTGPDLVCSNASGEFSVNLPPNMNVTWSRSSNLNVSSVSNHTYRVTAQSNISNQTGWVEAEILFPEGSSVVVRKTVEVGPPAASAISFDLYGPTTFYNQRWTLLGANYNPYGITLDKYTWEWQVPSSAVKQSLPTHSYIHLRPNVSNTTSIYIRTRASNECGCSNWYGKWFTVQSSNAPPCGSSGSPCKDDIIEY